MRNAHTHSFYTHSSCSGLGYTFVTKSNSEHDLCILSKQLTDRLAVMAPPDRLANHRAHIHDLQLASLDFAFSLFAIVFVTTNLSRLSFLSSSID